MLLLTKDSTVPNGVLRIELIRDDYSSSVQTNNDDDIPVQSSWTYIYNHLLLVSDLISCLQVSNCIKNQTSITYPQNGPLG